MGCEDNAPNGNRCAEIFAQWEPNGNVTAWPAPEEVSEVEYGGAPAVFATFQILVSRISRHPTAHPDEGFTYQILAQV
jgi:hypothetical protein